MINVDFLVIKKIFTTYLPKNLNKPSKQIRKSLNHNLKYHVDKYKENIFRINEESARESCRVSYRSSLISECIESKINSKKYEKIKKENKTNIEKKSFSSLSSFEQRKIDQSFTKPKEIKIDDKPLFALTILAEREKRDQLELEKKTTIEYY